MWRAGGGKLNTRRFLSTVHIFENKLTVFGGSEVYSVSSFLDWFFPLFYFSVKILHIVRKAVVFKISYSYIMLTPTGNIGITSTQKRPQFECVITIVFGLFLNSFKIKMLQSLIKANFNYWQFWKFSKNDINDLQMFLKVIKSRSGMEPNGIMLRTH